MGSDDFEVAEGLTRFRTCLYPLSSDCYARKRFWSYGSGSPGYV